MPVATTSQTIGPFWHVLADPRWADLTRFGAEGETIALVGTITDGAGAAVTDACVELWQPSPPASEVWDGFGRAAVDARGGYRFVTLRPGPPPATLGGNLAQAPHIAMTLFMRGLLIHVHTRAHFADDPLNERDPLLASLAPERRATLIARPDGTSDGLPAWRLDIRLQGDGETVFIDI